MQNNFSWRKRKGRVICKISFSKWVFFITVLWFYVWMSIKFNSKNYPITWRRNDLLLSILDIIYFSLLINSSTKFNDKILSVGEFFLLDFWIIFSLLFATHHVTDSPQANKATMEKKRGSTKFFRLILTNFICQRNAFTVYVIHLCCLSKNPMFVCLRTPEFSAIKHPENYLTKIPFISTYIITTSTHISPFHFCNPLPLHTWTWTCLIDCCMMTEQEKKHIYETWKW